MMRQLDRIKHEPLKRKITPRPKPQTFRIDEAVDVEEMRFMARHGVSEHEIMRRFKRSMVRRLAEHLSEHCKLFEFDFNRLMRERRVSIEITLDDRGTYERLVDNAERAGRIEGIMEAIEAMPYGLDQGIDGVYD